MKERFIFLVCHHLEKKRLANGNTHVSMLLNKETLVPKCTCKCSKWAFLELHEVSCEGKMCSKDDTCLGVRTGKKFKTEHKSLKHKINDMNLALQCWNGQFIPFFMVHYLGQSLWNAVKGLSSFQGLVRLMLGIEQLDNSLHKRNNCRIRISCIMHFRSE